MVHNNLSGISLKSRINKGKSSTYLKIISVLIFLWVSFLSGYTQDYRELVSNSIYVKYNSFDDVFFNIPNLKRDISDKDNTSKVASLVQKNVIGYYGLGKEYDTELKRKVFLSSQEGKELYDELGKLYDEVIKKDFYYLHDFNKYSSHYNLSTHRFETSKSVNELRYSKIQGYINFGLLCLSIPKTMVLDDVKRSYGGTNYFYDQYFSVPIRSEAMALDIENNINDCALLLIFNIDKTVEKQTALFEKDFILGKTKYVYVVNKKTGKIYSDSPEIKELERQQQEIKKQRAETERKDQGLKSVQIKGTLSGSNTEKIYLYELGNGRKDTVQLDAKGNFSFKQKISQPTFYSLTVNDRAITLLAHPGEELVITGNARHLPLTYSAEGNEDSKHIRRLSQRLEHTVFVGDSLDRCLQNYTGNQDIQRQFERIYINEVDSLRAYNIRFINQNPQSLVVIYALYQQLGQNDYLFNQEDDIKYFRKADSLFYKRYPEISFVKSLHANVVSMNEQMSLRKH